jgi:hypothetical protein
LDYFKLNNYNSSSLGIPLTSFSGLNTRTARNVRKSTPSDFSPPDGENGIIVSTLEKYKLK